MPAAQQQLSPQQIQALNMQARAAVLQAAVPMKQQIYSSSFAPSASNILNIPINNVGLIRGFFVKVTANITNSAAAGLSITPFGASNILSQITFTDLNNTVRINTAGWHLGLVNSAKQPLVMGGAYAPNVPVSYGNNWTVQSAPSTIAASGTGVVQFYYYVPLAYTAQDLRGAMYAGVVNATSTLQLTINPTPCVGSTDKTLAVYSGNAAGGYTAGNAVTVTVWQDYLDQLPLQQNGNVLLPPLDIQTIYELKNTALAGMVTGQDFGIPYANFRTFLSTAVVYDNGGSLNVGSDINYWKLAAANTTQMFQFGPQEAALFARAIFQADPPAGAYWFDMRNQPISTAQYGNMTLFMNPNGTVNTGAAALVGFEDFATVSQVQFASSLPNS